MSGRGGDLLITLLVVTGALAVYHLAFRDRPPAWQAGSEGGEEVGARDLAALRARIDALEAAPAARTAPPSGPEADLLARLEGRIVDLERASHGARPRDDGGADRPAGSSTPSDIGAFRAMLEEVKRLEQAEAIQKQVETIVTRGAPELTPFDSDRAKSRIAQFFGEMRTLQQEITASKSAEDRAETGKRSDEIRDRLRSDLEAFLPGPTVEKLLQVVPWANQRRPGRP